MGTFGGTPNGVATGNCSALLHILNIKIFIILFSGVSFFASFIYLFIYFSCLVELGEVDSCTFLLR